MKRGIITSIKSNIFTVNVCGKPLTCVGRGKLKNEGLSPLVGDRVLVEQTGDDEGVVAEILPRQNSLLRPPIANVDQVIIVIALKDPDPNFETVDRMLVLAEISDIEPVLCFNKCDLVKEKEIDKLISPYRKSGYPILVTSAVLGTGVRELQTQLSEKVSVFAGASGAGKSSLLNALSPGLRLKTGTVSERTGRGRHTTRHVELFSLPGDALVADTPGFTRLDLPDDLVEDELSYYFPEIRRLLGECRFNDCRHEAEPGCAVKEAAESGLIPERRYNSYLRLLKEIREKREY